MAHNTSERTKEIRRRQNRRRKQNKLRARYAAAKDEATKADLKARILKINPMAEL